MLHRKVYNTFLSPPDLLRKSKRLGLRKSPMTGDKKSSPKAIFLSAHFEMLIKIKVIPKSSRNQIKEEDGFLKAYLTAPPCKGKANKALVELLASYFHVSKSSIQIVKGALSHYKTVAVGD